jgi:hypothetical protein
MNSKEINNSNYYKRKLKESLESYVGKENTQELRDEICIVVEKLLPEIIEELYRKSLT